MLDIPEYLASYLPVIIFFGIALAISIFMISVPIIFFRKNNSVQQQEKLSPYECGFPPISDNQEVFDIKFYLVAVLFIIFDLEIAFLFPWSITLTEIGSFGFISMIIFLTVLTVGFVYEWKKGALEW